MTYPISKGQAGEAVRLPDVEDARFNPRRLIDDTEPGATELRAVVASILEADRAYRARNAPEKRPRGRGNGFRRTVVALVADLARLHVRAMAAVEAGTVSPACATACLYQPMSDAVLARRGNHPALSRAIREIIRLCRDGWCDAITVETVGHRGRASPFNGAFELGTATRFRAGPGIAQAMQSVRDAPVCLDTEPEPSDVIVFKAPNGDPAPLPRWSQVDTLREELVGVNQRLAEMDVGYVGPQFAVEPSRRTLYRTVKGDLRRDGGRFYGGWWIGMAKADRFDNIRLDGRSVVEVDMKSAFPSIAYALAGVGLPDGDIYSLPGVPADRRDGVKNLLAAMLGHGSGHSGCSWPRGGRDEETGVYVPSKAERLLRDIYTPRQARAAIRQAHPAILPWIDQDRFGELLRAESRIIAEALRRLWDEHHISCLPIHDCLLVPTSKAHAAVEGMQAAFKSITGGEVRVSIKG